MNRRIIGAVTAVLLAAMGTFVLLAYVRSAEDRALAGEQVVNVFVVRDTIAKGTSGDAIEGLVELKKIPAKVEAKGSVTSLSALDGKVAAVDLVAGEQLLATRFVSPEALTAQGQVDVPDGLHEVTVSLEPQRALGGRVEPGDTVAVFSSFDPFDGVDPSGGTTVKSPNTTHLILHKVLVTNVQNAGTAATTPGTGGGDQDTAAPSGNLLVTLAMDAPSAERLVFTAEHGFVWLSQEPEDAPEEGTSIQTRDTVYEK